MKKRAKSEFDRSSQDTDPRSLIRATILEEKHGIRDTGDEFIGQLIREEGETSPDNNSLTDIPTTQTHGSPITPARTSKTPKRSATSHVVPGRTSVPEWQILRLFSAVGGGFDLEMWWRRSDSNNRLIALLVVSLFLVALLHLGFAIAFIASSFTEMKNIKDPYICETGDCKKMAVRFNTSMNNDIEACDNFYEFMCGKYTETEVEGPIYAELITNPSFKVELGTDNIIGRILKADKNAPELNKQIQFFQTCLNFVKRANFSHETLARNAKQWFGTDNFTLFEGQTTSMEQIAANLLKAFGHASFINVGFYTYPYILILEPHNRTTLYRFDADERNRLFLRQIFRGLMPHLGLKSDRDDVINDMVNGTNIMSTVIHAIYEGVKKISGNDAQEKEIESLINDNPPLNELCPPMGINLDYSKVLDLFINDDYKVEYISPTARKYFLALQMCFKKEPSSSFRKFQIVHNRTAFVSLWIADIFLHEIIFGLNYKNMSRDWGFDSIGENHTFVGHIKGLALFNDEYVCLDTMWTVLGYLPTMRFLRLGNLGLDKDVVTWKLGYENQIAASITGLLNNFLQIPPTDIDWRELSLAKMVLQRGSHIDIGLPLVGGILGITADAMNFTDDFLGNTLEGFRYTVARAHQDWLGSTSPHPYIRFGDGGPGNIKDTLFIPHFIHADSARLVEQELARSKAKRVEWETFLGRKRLNLVRLPLSIFDDRNADIVSLQHAFLILPIYHSMFALVRDATSREKYPSLTFEELLGTPTDHRDGSNGNCSMLDTSSESSNETRHAYKMIPSNVSHYTWDKEELFLATLSAKLALLTYQRQWTYGYKRKPYKFTTNEVIRNFILHRHLPGDLRKYSGEQLFFMGYARQICRESWKSNSTRIANELKRQQHYALEATFLNVLMQMEEFSEAFKCKGNLMMNNKGEPRCFTKRWKIEWW